VNECKPKLDYIKDTLGARNELYHQLSNDLVNIALSCLVDYINSQTNPNSRIPLPPIIDERDIEVLTAIGKLGMNAETRLRYNKNKGILNNLLNKSKTTYNN